MENKASIDHIMSHVAEDFLWKLSGESIDYLVRHYTKDEKIQKAILREPEPLSIFFTSLSVNGYTAGRTVLNSGNGLSNPTGVSSTELFESECRKMMPIIYRLMHYIIHDVEEGYYLVESTDQPLISKEIAKVLWDWKLLEAPKFFTHYMKFLKEVGSLHFSDVLQLASEAIADGYTVAAVDMKYSELSGELYDMREV